MSHQVITVQVGQCGNQIGCKFWNLLASEHNLDKNGQFNTKNVNDIKTKEILLEKIHTHCYETSQSLQYNPLTVIVDSDPGMRDKIPSLSNWCNNDINDNSMFGEYDMGNNFAKGHLTDGAELIDEIMDIIRSKCEKSEYPVSFQSIYSLGGGTGSGLGSLINMKMRDEYPDKISTVFIVWPSPKVSDVKVEPYNAGLSHYVIHEVTDISINFDNSALFDILMRNNKNKTEYEPKYADFNDIIASTICDITSQWRFNTFNKLNKDYRQFANNMVPFPWAAKCLSISNNYGLYTDDMADAKDDENGTQTVKTVGKHIWNADNLLIEHDDEVMNLVSSSIYRLNRNRFGLYDSLSDTVDLYASKMKLYELNVKELNTIFIPNNVLSTLSYNHTEPDKMNGSLVWNTPAIRKMFQRVSQQYDKMYSRKAFIHWYKGEGGDECMMQTESWELKQMVTSFTDKQQTMFFVDAISDNDDDDDYDEDDDEEEDEDEEEEYDDDD